MEIGTILSIYLEISPMDHTLLIYMEQRDVVMEEHRPDFLEELLTSSFYQRLH